MPFTVSRSRILQKGPWICKFFYFCTLIKKTLKQVIRMYWTLELASYLEDAPWPATKDELIDFSIRSGAPLEVVENLQELEDDGQPYESIEEIWPDYPTKDDFFFNEDEY
jgi:hypothetical protein